MTSNIKRLVVIDGLNMFLRNLVVNPTISVNGQPIGGTVGFLNSIKKVINETKPTQIVVVWDGPGGSQRRRATVKEYKEGRKPLKKNYVVDGMSEQSELQNKLWQQQVLMEILNNTPIMQLMLESVEADDVIAYVVKLQEYAEWQKLIISADKDFIQLLDNKTLLYQPIAKKIYSKKTVKEEFGISVENFAVARAIVGDVSDNLAGVPGAGLKTVSKRLEFLSENKYHDLDSVFNYCESKSDSHIKLYSAILQNRPLIETNYKMMNLSSPIISFIGKEKILYSLHNFSFQLNATEIKRISYSNGLSLYVWDETFSLLNTISGMNKKRNT